MLDKIKNRIQKQGLFSTFNYFLFTVVFEKLGIEIIKYFSIHASVDSPSSSDVLVFLPEETLPVNIEQSIYRECGDKYKEYIIKKKAIGGVLAVGVVGDSVASIAWLTLTSKSYKNKLHNYWLINACLTFPSQRGKGYYPKMIQALCLLAVRKEQVDVKVFIESSWANKASIKGILKCGFQNAGISILFRDKLLFEKQIF